LTAAASRDTKTEWDKLREEIMAFPLAKSSESSPDGMLLCNTPVELEKVERKPPPDPSTLYRDTPENMDLQVLASYMGNQPGLATKYGQELPSYDERGILKGAETREDDGLPVAEVNGGENDEKWDAIMAIQLENASVEFVSADTVCPDEMMHMMEEGIGDDVDGDME
jgi:hypothetical protein